MVSVMNSTLNGTTMCVAAIRELWVKPKVGDSFPVHSIVDKTVADSPFYDVYVTDYRGNSYDFCELSCESQEELVYFATRRILGRKVMVY